MISLAEKIRETYRLIRERGDDGVWLSLVPEEKALERAAELESSDLPLRGKTFAVKDNIDVAGLPTTAACPEFSYVPEKSAFVVQRLLDAGAIVIGKTNLDQFATGLNGTRTPHTIPRNAFHPEYISGGSSSGSAIAVALGEVDFALGTDTAGSGRVPAAFNNLVGLKPTKGRWSTTGLVPACRSLDCITVLARNLGEAAEVDRVVAGFDAEDPFSRPESHGFWAEKRKLAVPVPSQREFFGDAEYARLYAEAMTRVQALGWEVVEFDYEPFLAAAALLYNGPWVAERHAAMRDFLAERAEAVHPVVRGIVEGAGQFSATDAFEAQYRLADLVRRTEGLWTECDAMLLPTAGTIYTVEQMLADPVRLNSNLGRYTNFVNLMDLCGVAVPAGFRADGLPFGVTFLGPAWTEERLLRCAGEFLGQAVSIAAGGVRLAVVGAHLRGQPLNRQLRDLGAVFVEQTHTAPCYRLFALPGTTPPKPGLVRDRDGFAIEVEVWQLSETGFGRFVAAIPAPLGIGTVELASGEMVKGFLCEGLAVEGAEEISRHGGWRAYLAADS
jgi:allophanate hydrolase